MIRKIIAQIWLFINYKYIRNIKNCNKWTTLIGGGGVGFTEHCVNTQKHNKCFECCNKILK